MASGIQQIMQPDRYLEIVAIYRENPGKYNRVAKTAKIDYSTAKKYWEKGVYYYAPIKDILAKTEGRPVTRTDLYSGSPPPDLSDPPNASSHNVLKDLDLQPSGNLSKDIDKFHRATSEGLATIHQEFAAGLAREAVAVKVYRELGIGIGAISSRLLQGLDRLMAVIADRLKDQAEAGGLSTVKALSQMDRLVKIVLQGQKITKENAEIARLIMGLPQEITEERKTGDSDSGATVLEALKVLQQAQALRERTVRGRVIDVKAVKATEPAVLPYDGEEGGD